MGFRLSLLEERAGTLWEVGLAIQLTRQELTEVFLRGDVMLSWSEEGLVGFDRPCSNADEVADPGGSGSPLERTSMFVSEIAGKQGGLRLLYASEAGARRAATLIRLQLASVGIDEVN